MSGFYHWKIMEDKILNRTGRWYLSVMNVSLDFTINDLVNDSIPEDKILSFRSDYNLRTWTSGCYFYEENTKAWISVGMEIRTAEYGVTDCRSNHLTAFGTGFFVIPNDFNFDFIFSKASFEDNLTIYLCLIVSLITYLMLTLWAR